MPFRTAVVQVSSLVMDNAGGTKRMVAKRIEMGKKKSRSSKGFETGTITRGRETEKGSAGLREAFPSSSGRLWTTTL